MRSIIQSKVRLLLVIIGVTVAMGSCSPNAQDDTPAPTMSGATKTEETGESGHHTLREEVATLFSRFDQAYGIPRLGEDMAVEIKGAKIRGIDAYDNIRKKYVTAWMDTMGTGIFLMEGTASPDGRTITLTGHHETPGGGQMNHRAVWKLVDANNQTFGMYGTHSGDKERKMFQITYTRK